MAVKAWVVFTRLLSAGGQSSKVVATAGSRVHVLVAVSVKSPRVAVMIAVPVSSELMVKVAVPSPPVVT